MTTSTPAPPPTTPISWRAVRLALFGYFVKVVMFSAALLTCTSILLNWGVQWGPFRPAVTLRLRSPNPNTLFNGTRDHDAVITGRFDKAPYTHVWLVVSDEAQNWYPLDEAFRRQGAGQWTTRLRKEQLAFSRPANDLLQVVIATDYASNALYAQLHKARGGLPNLPPGAHTVDAIPIIVAPTPKTSK